MFENRTLLLLILVYFLLATSHATCRRWSDGQHSQRKNTDGWFAERQTAECTGKQMARWMDPL